MTLRKVTCVINDAEYIEDMPEGSDDITLGVKVVFQITASDDPDDIGLFYISMMTKEEFQDVIEFPRDLSSGELVKIVKKLNNHDGSFSLILDTDAELISPRMFKLEDVPIRKIRTVDLNRKTSPETQQKSSQFSFRKRGDLPIGNVDLSDHLK